MNNFDLGGTLASGMNSLCNGEDTGFSLDSTLASGITSNAYMPMNAMGAVSEGMSSEFDSLLLDTDGCGIDINSQLASDITSSSYMPLNAVSEMTDGMNVRISDMVAQNKKKAGLIPSEMGEAIYADIDSFNSAMESIKNGADIRMSDMVASGKELAGLMPSKMGDGIRANEGKFTSAINNMALNAAAAGKADVQIDLKVNSDGLQISLNDISTFTKSAMEKLTQIQPCLSQEMKSCNLVVSTASRMMHTSFSEMISKVISAIKNGMNTAVSSVQNGMNNMVSVVSGTSLYNAGVNLMMGFNNGIASMSSTISMTAQNIANNVKTTVERAMQIHSPSRVMERLGEFTGLGYVKGSENTLPQISQTANEMAEASIPYCDDYTLSDSPSAYSQTTTSEYINYAPVFNLTISGASDERALERKVKKWIGEKLEETFESYERKNGLVREV